MNDEQLRKFQSQVTMPPSGKDVEGDGGLWLPGSRMGQYRIVRFLGRGGMGAVYEAEHEVLHRRYALKFLSDELLRDSGARARFEREAQVMANLEHPNIVRVDDFGESDGKYWLRMELAEGVEDGERDTSREDGRTPSLEGERPREPRLVTLRELSDAYGGKLPQDLLHGILKQVAAGLAYAYGKGVVHRDLKPGNVLLFGDSDGVTLKITDFGLVKVVGEEWLRSRAELSVRHSMLYSRVTGGNMEESERTSEQALLGTYEYMSPEQRRGEEATSASDVYALGMMTFRLLTGREPGAKPPSRIDRSLWDGWDDLVIDALEAEPGERPKDAGEFLARLEGIEGGDLTAKDAREKKEKDRKTTNSTNYTNEDESGDRVESVPQAFTPRHKDFGAIDLGGGVRLEMVYIGPGAYMRGSPVNELGRWADEGPRHRVTLAKGFWLGKYPVTQEQWECLMDGNPSRFRGASNPVERVSWHDAKDFLGRLELQLTGDWSGWKARLPTEAEWEYACRAGNTGAYCFGDGEERLGEYGWFAGNSKNRTHPVGQKKPNAWGLYDMHGNVWEWCEDCWHDSYNGAPTDGSAWLSDNGNLRVVRGGAWYNYASDCRSACRDISNPENANNNNNSFRVVLSR